MLAVAQERQNEIVIIRLPWASRRNAPTNEAVAYKDAIRKIKVDVNTHSPNKGVEGVAYDRVTETLYAIVEKKDMRVVRIDYADGSQIEPFDAQEALAKSGIKDIAGAHFDPDARTLMIVSEDSKAVVQVGLDGTIIDQTSIPKPAQPEGIVFTSCRNAFFIISEPNTLYLYESAAMGDCERRTSRSNTSTSSTTMPSTTAEEKDEEEEKDEDEEKGEDEDEEEEEDVEVEKGEEKEEEELELQASTSVTAVDQPQLQASSSVTAATSIALAALLLAQVV